MTGLTEQRIGDIAFANGVRLHHLSPSRASLEQAFMELTEGSLEYGEHGPARATRDRAHDFERNGS